MRTPYTVLGVSEQADDKAIKKAYLKAVRNNPPDRHPERFRKIRRAYEQVATLKDRLRYELFDTSVPDRLEIAEVLLEPGNGNSEIAEETFQRALNHAIDKKTVVLE